MPKERRFFRIANIGLQQRIAANGVGQIKGRSLLVAAINLECLFVTWGGLRMLSLISENVGNVPYRVGQQKRIFLGAAKINGIVIVPEGSGSVAHVSLNLSQP